jgi:hypothetical protein
VTRCCQPDDLREDMEMLLINPLDKLVLQAQPETNDSSRSLSPLRIFFMKDNPKSITEDH